MVEVAQKRVGNQKPRIDIYENGDIWLADKTIRLVESYGMTLLPWQKRVIYRWMAVNEDGTWTDPDCGLEVPRQNGKTELFLVRIIGGMIFLGEALIYTAQSDNTVSEIKRRLQRFFYDAKDEIRNMLTEEFDKEPKTLDYVELRNRGRCVFRTRTRTNGLGATNDTLLIDEAQEETDAQQEALLPTISAGKNHNQQTIRAGTPPSGGGSGTVFIRKRRNVLDGKVTDVCWIEWSVESITDPSDEDAWYNCNPSLGYHLMVSAVKKEAGEMAIDSFNKMRLGWIAGTESQRAISDDLWLPLAVKKVELPENYSRVYAIKFAPDRSSVSLAVGVPMPSGLTHIEIIERKPMSAGTHWLVAWLLGDGRWKKAAKIIIDGAAGTQLLVEELVRSERRMSKKILTPNVKEAGAAYGAFMEGIEQGLLTHLDQPGLNVSIRTVKRRDIGRDGMFGYASMNADIQSDPTEAAAFAYYGANRFKKAPGTGSTQRIMI
jgi:hypothetical protein